MPTLLDLNPVKYASALIDLGISQAIVYSIRSSPRDKGTVLLDAMKRAAKLRYRKLAFELHPDRNKGDAAKTARFTFLSQVMRDVEAWVWAPLPPPPPIAPQKPAPIQVQTRAVQVQTPQSRASVRVSFQAGQVKVASSPQPVKRPANPGAPAPNGLNVVTLRPT